MSYWEFLRNVAKIKMAQAHNKEPVHFRTPSVPLNLSQESAVNISRTPIILAEGTLIRPPQQQQLITAVGECVIGSTKYFHSYLSADDGTFLQSADAGGGKVQVRVFVPYAEVNPNPDDPADWYWWLNHVTDWQPRTEYAEGDVVLYGEDKYLKCARSHTSAAAFEPNFWVDTDGKEAEGYIGATEATNKDEDGKLVYHRQWSPGARHIPPRFFSEKVTDASGASSKFDHRAMLYARKLGDAADAPNEYLLVSAVETPEGASVNMWLGLDLTASDLTVYPAN